MNRINHLISVVMLMGLAVTAAMAQPVGEETEGNYDWQLSFMGGVFTGGDLIKPTFQGERIKANASDTGLIGVRYGADSEFLGFELSFESVFFNLELKGFSGLDLPEANDATMFLFGINGMVYPFGNELNHGRLRPYITAGPGLAYFASDFDELDGEVYFDLNAGLGMKLLLGDTGNPIIRAEYRWHYLDGKDIDEVFHQELVVGIGFRF